MLGPCVAPLSPSVGVCRSVRPPSVQGKGVQRGRYRLDKLVSCRVRSPAGGEVEEEEFAQVAPG
jgi:hypothetical protein